MGIGKSKMAGLGKIWIAAVLLCGAAGLAHGSTNDVPAAAELEILPRSAWGAREPSSPLKPFDNSKLTHIVAHWPGSKAAALSTNTAVHLRGYQKWHMEGRKWRDIGYNYAVDAAGRVYELRGWNVGGHVLGSENSRSVGIIFVLGSKQEMTPEMRNSGHALAQWIERKAGKRLKKIGHCDWADKNCPGPYVLPWVRAGMPAAAE